ncbi:MAG: HD domain-containing protein [Paludibacteraceae bacterium]|nr:HD domain-containing protein [Paludibacteraceae bacterium]MBN2788039.1 HD domain-containing protein [Paludibacteraceae bacterium]
MNYNKRKIINDPVLGFITIPTEFLYDLIQHPYMQRLNRIKQLGLASFVYPGTQHTRFQHSIGAMHLMNETINQLRFKGIDITDEEAEAVLAAILLHDIGHGPFSHALEHSIVKNIHHETLSLLLIEKINAETNGKLDLAISIFNNNYHKKFLHQLVSGQLDMDRLDYLVRDSFYSGVAEGTVGAARIIKMLTVKDDCLVVEAKGIYSIENFLIARRLMYWQVYLHKTAVAAECMLVNILKRAKELSQNGTPLFATPALQYFLTNTVTIDVFETSPAALSNFVLLDDSDVISALKVWASHPDIVLSTLSQHFINRKLFKVKTNNKKFSSAEKVALLKIYQKKYAINNVDAKYFLHEIGLTNDTYNSSYGSVKILYNDGSVKDISNASDILNTSILSKNITKHFLCFLQY